MENRITRFVIPLLIGLVAWLVLKEFVFPGEPKKQGEQQVKVALEPGQASTLLNPVESLWSDPLVVGELGEVGFRARFHNLGGALATVDMLDQVANPGDEEALRAVVAEIGVFSFTIDDFLGKFPVRVPKGYRPNEGTELYRLNEVWWRPVKAGDNEVAYELALENGITFRKTFRVFKGSRRLQLVFQVKNTKDNDLSGLWTYRLRGATVMSNPKSQWGFMNPARCFAKFDEDLTAAQPSRHPNPVDLPDVGRGQAFVYAGSASRFFMCVLSPADEATKKAVTAVEAASLPMETGGVPDEDAYTNVASVLTVRQRVPSVAKDAAEATSKLTFDIYLGPKSREILNSDPDLTPYAEILDLDVGGCCIPGGATMSKFLLSALKFLQGILGNWGLAIIFLTIIVKALLLPINFRQQKSMRVYSDKMAKLKPEMDRLRKKHESNQQKMNQELMKFQKEHKLFPPLMGCLPMLLTMPIFIGLFMMLRTSFELRHEPFFSWITDLSMPDRLFYLGGPDLKNAIGCIPFPLPDFTYLNLLPILFTTLWVVNSFGQKISEDPQQRQMQKMMRFMPIMFAVMLYNYASGLALYMTISALWSTIEMRIIKKKLGGTAPGMGMTM